MKPINKTTLLAASIALAGLTYLPSASAYTTDEQGNYTNTSVVADSAGDFSSWYDFIVSDSTNSKFDIIATVNSRTNASAHKTELYSFNLFDRTHIINLGTGSVFQPTSTSSAGWVVNNSSLLQGSYALLTTGHTFSQTGSYSLSLTTAPSAVPLPGAVWMMLTGMIGLLGYQARNKKTA